MVGRDGPCRNGQLHLCLVADPSGPAQGVVVRGCHEPVGLQCRQPHDPRCGRSRWGHALPDAVGLGHTPAEAAGALAATSILSTAAVFAIPTVALGMAILGAPIPEDLEPVAAAGAVMFLVLLVVGFVAHRYDRPLLLVGQALDGVASRLPGRLARRVDPSRLVEERDRLVSVLGDTWGCALAAVAGNWAFDYLTLVCALYGVGADPRLSLVLLAYAGAVVTSMIPLTPGGFGFVEAALVWLLVLSGISTEDAALATLAYRIVTLLLPLCAALPAWIAYRRWFRTTTRPDDHRSDEGGADPERAIAQGRQGSS